ncbi:hypothetical protein F2Q70_00029760 [Brassica cretica]|uniref:Uncharacterized protein n=1 Tax=Brassica cretica TaxID=69181 RepID=A0A8S9FJX8_BRACR|nr:hypothetical protein F2Q70_00029760 [Brassica cretica]
MDSHSGLRAGLLIAFRILDAPRGFDVVALASCLVSGLYRDFWQGTFGMFGLVLGDNLVDSWNPKVGWTFVRNLMVVLTSKGTFSYIFLTRSRLRRERLPMHRPTAVGKTWRCCWDREVSLGPGGHFWCLEAALDPEVVFRTCKINIEPKGPGGRLGTKRFLQTLRSYLGPGVREKPKFLVLHGPYSASLDETTLVGISHSTARKLVTIDARLYCFPRLVKQSGAPCISQYFGTYIASPVLYSLERFNTGTCAYEFWEPRYALGYTWVLGSFDNILSRNFFMREFEDWGPTRENLKTWVLLGSRSNIFLDYLLPIGCPLSFDFRGEAWAMLEPEGESFFHMIDRGLDKYSQVLDMFEGCDKDGLAVTSVSVDIPLLDIGTSGFILGYMEVDHSSMSTGRGPMSALHRLASADPFRMSSSPYREASLLHNCYGMRGPEAYGEYHPGAQRETYSTWKPEVGTRRQDPDPGAGPWKLEVGTWNLGRKKPGPWRNNTIFFIGLHVLHRSIRLLVEFGIGRRLVEGMLQWEYETLLPWWGLVGVCRKFDGEAGNVCVKGDASAQTQMLVLLRNSERENVGEAKDLGDEKVQ